MTATTSRYVPALAVRDDVMELVTKHRVMVTDIAKIAGLHMSTIERVLANPHYMLERSTVTKISTAYKRILTGEVQLERFRVGKEARRGHPSTWTTCIWDHPYTERNTYIDIHGKRRCRICLAQRRAKSRAKKALREAS